jgi:hypothetical protein
MRGQHRPIPWHESAAELDALYQQECNDQRLVADPALWLLCQGHSLSDVSRAVDVEYRTVQRWVAWYRQQGLAAVVRRTPGMGQQGDRPASPPRSSPR